MSGVQPRQYATVVAAAVGAAIAWLSYFGVLNSTVLLGAVGVIAVAGGAYFAGRQSVDVDVDPGGQKQL